MKSLMGCFGAICAILVQVGTTSAEEGSPKITLHLLDHTDEQQTKTRFWIDWSKKWRGIVSTKSISGVEAEKVIKQLRVSLKNTEAENFCGHDPIYGMVATDEGGNVLETSLCFTCNTWVKPGKRLDIAGKSGAENELYRLLREIIELPEDLLEN